jgi:CubicO group peptidase (beta-lactamase class C family)
MRGLIRITIYSWILAWWTGAHSDAPFIDPAQDREHLGDPNSILFWSTSEKVAGFRNIDAFGQTRRVEAGRNPCPLPRDEQDLSALGFAHEGRDWTVEEYVRRQNVAGLLVIKDGRIVYERYELGNTDESRWISFSVAKSVTSLLVGAALKDGYIASIDERVSDYLPRLKGSSYDDSSIRHLLQMASGVAWNEDYADPKADINTVTWNTLEMYEYLRHKPRDHSPGDVFNYNTAETNLVGTLLRSAIGNNLSTYLSEKIWKPFGMEHHASWSLTEPGGGEFGGSSINATLRDYGRIGLFVLNDGRLRDGSRVLPEGWLEASTAPSPASEGYGYLWWLRGEGAFAASGIFGQGIHIVPEEKVVIALHSAREHASRSADWALQLAMFNAITASVSQK